MKIRAATEMDLDKLAEMNWQLIEDEGHRNQMSLLELRERMAVWLQHEYQAVMLCHDDEVAGYVVWRDDGGFIYIRQFFVVRELRRNGLGKDFFLNQDKISGMEREFDLKFWWATRLVRNFGEL